MDQWFGDRDDQLMGNFDSVNETHHWTLWLLLELVFVVVVLGSPHSSLELVHLRILFVLTFPLVSILVWSLQRM